MIQKLHRVAIDRHPFQDSGTFTKTKSVAFRTSPGHTFHDRSSWIRFWILWRFTSLRYRVRRSLPNWCTTARISSSPHSALEDDSRDLIDDKSPNYFLRRFPGQDKCLARVNYDISVWDAFRPLQGLVRQTQVLPRTPSRRSSLPTRQWTYPGASAVASSQGRVWWHAKCFGDVTSLLTQLFTWAGLFLQSMAMYRKY